MNTSGEPSRTAANEAFDLGRQLLGGGNAADPRRGVELVDEACAEGHPDATALAAAFHAMGALREQSWDRAFELLQLAAERGSALARKQLLLLAGPGAGIDIRALLQPRPAKQLSASPLIRAIRGFASAAECSWLIERATPRLKPAAVWDGGGARVAEQRSNSALSITLADTDLVTEILRARISTALQLPVAIFEPPQILHYAVGQEFVPHYDFLDPQHPDQAAALAQAGQRMGTFLVYLNGEFEGGETNFPKTELKFRGSAGDALFFANVTPEGQPDPRTLHAGLPPTSGEKWVMSNWIRDRTPG